MASETEAQVKFTADVKSLLTGMQEAKESVEGATSGMKGDIGALLESFEKLGPAALAAGGIGLAFEGLKEGIATISEATKVTDELARSFETLKMRTGASWEELTVFKNAMVLSGGSTEDFSGLLTGLAKKMSANTEIYIANHIAADESELSHQNLMVTLAKTVQVIAAVEEPGRRAEMALALLGGRSQAMLPQIMRMNEIIEKEGVDGLKKYGATIDNEAIEKMKTLEHQVGTVKLEIEKVDQVLADSGRGWAAWSEKATLAWKEFIESATRQRGPLAIIEAEMKTLPGGAPAAKPGEAAKTGESEAPAAAGGSVTPKELEAQKKAHTDAITIARGTAAEKLKIAVESANEQIKTDTNMLATEMMTFDEFIADKKAQAEVVWNAEQASAASQIKLAEGNAVLIATINNQMADNKRKYYATLEGLSNESAKHDFDLLKSITESTAADNKRANDLRIKQDEAARKMREEGELKTDMDIYKSRMAMMGTLTSGWDQSIAKMVNGTLTWKDGLHTAMSQLGQNFEQMVIKMGLQWGMHELAKTAASQASASYRVATEEEAAVKSVAIWLWAGLKNIAIKAWEAAAAAFASIAAIPVVGPALAPLAAAGALAAVIGIGSHLASAEGGWDRVPSDQVALIHKNEMVLPAPLAESVRNMASGGGGGGGQAIHIHAMDAQSFNHALKNNIGGLRDVLHQAVRNGRLG